MALFRPKVDHTEQIAHQLARLVELYELDLRSRGITTQDSDEVGEVYLTSPDFLEQEEAKNAIRTQLGLPDHYDVGGALPSGSAGFGQTPQEAREAAEERFALHAFPPGVLQDAYSTPWGVGPEGAEKPKEHPDG
jgi:hypothetical protein